MDSSGRKATGTEEINEITPCDLGVKEKKSMRVGWVDGIDLCFFNKVGIQIDPTASQVIIQHHR